MQQEMKQEKELKTLPINVEQFYVKSPPYFQTANNNMDYLVSHMEQDSPTPLCFVGPKGTGKTLVIAHFASENNIPIIQYDCSENTRKGDLIGRYILRGDETAYQLGVLPSAIELANEVGQAILVLEELNALAPNMQKQLNQLLDWRRHVFADNGKTYTLNKGAKLLVCATMNPSTYGGVFELNEDLISRWAQIWVQYPTKEEEKSIATINGFDKRLLPAIVQKGAWKGNEVTEHAIRITEDQVWRLVYETRTKSGLSYAISPRDVVQFLTAYQDYLPTCLKEQEEKHGHDVGEILPILRKSDEDIKEYFVTSLKNGLNGMPANERTIFSYGSTYAFSMAIEAFVVGKYQDASEKETIKQRISSIFGDGIGLHIEEYGEYRIVE